ncbi:MAG: homocysteine methyltransferase [candidate division Zixibacteria bacterium SM23_73_3]|nr:MAG: homocysteine methyltransferase [candidate division Zixibacteria bacterium SM23_73_3]
MFGTFLERLKKGTMLCDGAMGTLLYMRGVSYERSFDEQNISNPKIVQNVHRDYIKAGAEIIETNTFGANGVRLKNFGLEDKVGEINIKGAKIAREAREIEGRDVFVAGSIGPVGKPLAPLGELSEKEALEVFQKQAEALLEGGVDLFIVETFSDLLEIKQAVLAIRNICQLPIIASMTFDEDGKTFLGYSPEEVADKLSNLGVEIIGANCSVGPQKMLDVVGHLRKATNRMISVQPNAGVPRYVDGRFIYLSSPEYFAQYAKEYIKSGANIIGGCCGTTPEYIKALSKMLEDIKTGTAPEEKTYITVEERIKEEEPTEWEEEKISEFARKLGKEFVVSVEVDPPKGINTEKILKNVEKLKQIGVNAINIADSPMARVRMSCVSLAYLIKQKIGIETILHLTCRDRNLMGLQSDLLGVHALGIHNILAVTGDPPVLGDYPQATAVYDVDSIGLVKIINKLNQGTDWAGNSIGSPTFFCVGVAVNPTADDLKKEIDRFEKKVEAGADFAFTQPLYDLKILKQFLQEVSHVKIPLFLGVLPLRSYKHTEFLHYEVPGINIPEKIRERMKRAKDRSYQVGTSVAKEMMEQAKGMVDGVYLMPSFGRFEMISEVLEGFIPSRTTIFNK